MKRKHKRIVIFLLAMFWTLCVPLRAFAGEIRAVSQSESRSSESWLYGMDQSEIYGDSGETDFLSDDQQENENEDSHIFEKLLMMLVNSIANALSSLLEKGHISLESVIMGRVDGHGVAVQSEVLGNHVIALFTFELTPGNIWGIVASLVYTILRSVIYIVIVCAVYAKVVAAGWSGNAAKARQAFKSACSELVVLLLLLALMPYLLDVIFYIRDIFLHLIFSALRDGVGLDASRVSGLSDVFKELSDTGILNSLMYLGSVVITVWFMMQYIGLALTFCIYFFCFPFVCINALYSRNELMEWWKGILGYSIVPLGDVVLLFLPAAFGLLGDSFVVSVIQFCICASLIPSRSVLRALMGIRSNFAMEMAAMGALGGAVNFAGGVMRGFGRTVTGVAGGVADIRRGQMYEDLGQSENSSDSAYNFGSNRETQAEQQTFERYANVSNFENPEFDKLSNEQRAKLYRQRGLQRLAGAAVGGVAGMGGAAVGAGTGMFMGLNTAGQYGSSLASNGASLGAAGVAYGSGFLREVEDMKNVAVSSVQDAGAGASQAASSFNAGGDETSDQQVAEQDGGVPPMEPATPVAVEDPMPVEGMTDMYDVAPVNIPAEVVTEKAQNIASFANPKFKSYIGRQYDDIMSDQRFTTPQQRADELQTRASNYTQNQFNDWITKKYPSAPKEVIDTYRGGVDNFVTQRYRFDENSKENTWSIYSSHEGAGDKNHDFTFEK